MYFSRRLLADFMQLLNLYYHYKTLSYAKL